MQVLAAALKTQPQQYRFCGFPSSGFLLRLSSLPFSFSSSPLLFLAAWIYLRGLFPVYVCVCPVCPVCREMHRRGLDAKEPPAVISQDRDEKRRALEIPWGDPAGNWAQLPNFDSRRSPLILALFLFQWSPTSKRNRKRGKEQTLAFALFCIM